MEYLYYIANTSLTLRVVDYLRAAHHLFLAIKPGADRISSLSPLIKQDVEQINQELNSRDFKGMVENRMPKLKKQ